jgi:hypothetical protein
MTEKPRPEEASAAAFIAALETKRPEAGRVPMREIVALATRYVEMNPEEIEKLLEESAHEARIGAVSVMGKQARRKRTTAARRRELYELFLRRTDRIDTWDLVDVSAHHVVGGYLADMDRDVLYRLARSEKWWERRIGIRHSPRQSRGEVTAARHFSHSVHQIHGPRHSKLDTVAALLRVSRGAPDG